MKHSAVVSLPSGSTPSASAGKMRLETGDEPLSAGLPVWRSWGLCLGAAALVALGGAWWGQRESAQQRESRQRLSDMSAADRAHVQRNLETWRSLPEADRQTLRTFHQSLQEPRPESRHLRDTLDEYHTWFATLTPGQQDDLRQEADLSRKLGLVEKFRAEQDLQAQRSGKPDTGHSAMGFFQPLTTSEFSAIMHLLEQAMRKHLPTDQVKRLDQHSGMRKDIFMLESAIRSEGDRKGLLLAPSSHHLIDDMISKITSEPQGSFLRSKPHNDARRGGLLLLLGRTLFAEHERLRPDAETLERYFTQLPGPQRDELMRLSPAEHEAQLSRLYMKAYPDVYPPLPPEFLRLMQRLPLPRSGGDRFPSFTFPSREGGPREGGSPRDGNGPRDGSGPRDGGGHREGSGHRDGPPPPAPGGRELPFRPGNGPPER